MLKLRKFLVGVFGYVAAVFGFASIGTVTLLLRRARFHYHLKPDSRLTAGMAWWSSVLFILSEAVLVMPPLIAFLYGMAWWKIRSPARSGRGWAIAASITMFLQAVPISIASYYAIAYASRGAGGWRAFSLIDIAMLALGIAGLVAFGSRSAIGVPVVSARKTRVAGDGTSGFLDVAVWVLSVAGYWFGWSWLEHWGRAHGLNGARGLGMWGNLIVAGLISTALHEAGHAIVAIALDMRVRAFFVGPFQFYVRQGRWRFKFAPSQIVAAGGAVGAVPTNANQPLWHELVMIAAGPLASLLTGAIALMAVLAAERQFYEPCWELIGMIGIFGILAFVANLIPVRPEGLYSDGAKIYQLLSGGPCADFHRAVSIAGATLETTLRPRDYDMQAIERASRAFTQGSQAVWLRLLATSHFVDGGNIPRARQTIAEAESILRDSSAELSEGLFAVLTFDIAFLRHDALAARRWADRLAAKNSESNESSVDYWLAQAAVHWIENHLEDARTSLARADAVAEKLPAAGAYDYDRYRCTLLRQELDTQSSDEPLTVSTVE